MSQLHSVDIDGRNYQFADWTTSKGISILTWLAKKVGGTLAAFFAVGLSQNPDATDEEKVKQISEAGDKLFTDALQSMLSSLDSSDVNRVLKMICEEDLLCDGKKVNYDFHYRKSIGHLMRVAKSNLEYQFDDFLGELLSLAKQQGAKVPTQSEQKTTES